MKKYIIYRLPLTVLLCLVLLVSNFTVFGASDKVQIDTELVALLTEYFELRENTLTNSISTNPNRDSIKSIEESITGLTSSSELVSMNIARLSASQNLEIYHGVFPVKYDNSFVIREWRASNSATGTKSYTIDVYEWTWVEYTNGVDTDINRMGYGIEHNIVINSFDDGKSFDIVSDSYNETPLIQQGTKTFEQLKAEDVLDSVKNELTVRASGTNSNISLEVNRLIDYADQYVIHEYASGMITSYYNNSTYGYYPGADCANFVSQCLFAGGMIDDYGSGKNYANPDATQWWYDRGNSPANNSLLTCPPAWRNVADFKLYWTKKGYSVVTASNSTVFPGNPVLEGTNHVTICVGYNSSGTPIVNGHNPDVYHVPYTYAGIPLNTIQLTTSNKMNSKPNQATLISPTSSLQSIQKTIGNCANHYYKFNVNTEDNFVFYSTGSIDVKATLYKESRVSTEGMVYLYQYAVDDNSGSGTNFRIEERLVPGTYYIRVRTVSQSISGQYTFLYRTD